MLRHKGADGTWKRSPAARGKNGQVKPNHVLVGGQVVQVEPGMYSIRHTVDRKTVYTPAGTKSSIAAAKCEQLQRTKSIVATAEDNPDVVVSERPERQTLRGTAAAYIAFTVGKGAMEAAEQARLVSAEFLLACKRTYVDEVTQNDFFAFHDALRKQGRSDRTVTNKHCRLASWLKFAGIDPKHVPPRPRFEATLPDMYSPSTTAALRGHGNPYMRMLVTVALKTGLRDQELRHLEFSDINWVDSTLRVRAKPRWGYHVKTWEQRNVPVPKDLLADLKIWQEAREGQTLIFGTANRAPNTKLLLALKVLARQAGLNCGVCESCVGKNKECEEFTLHRFRRTYLTTLLRQGIDLRTVQAYAGHKDIASTMRYLSPETGPEAQAKLNLVKW